MTVRSDARSDARSATAPKAKAKPGPRQNKSLPGEVRIIGGIYKRTKLPVADKPGLRPTPDSDRIAGRRPDEGDEHHGRDGRKHPLRQLELAGSLVVHSGLPLPSYPPEAFPAAGDRHLTARRGPRRRRRTGYALPAGAPSGGGVTWRRQWKRTRRRPNSAHFPPVPLLGIIRSARLDGSSASA